MNVSTIANTIFNWTCRTRVITGLPLDVTPGTFTFRPFSITNHSRRRLRSHPATPNNYHVGRSGPSRHPQAQLRRHPRARPGDDDETEPGDDDEGPVRLTIRPFLRVALARIAPIA